MKNHFRLVIALTLVCLFWTALLVGVNALTRERIATGRQRRELAAARVVAPAENLRRVRTTTATNFVALDADGRLAGAAVRGFSPNGYGGSIGLMVGFAADGTLHDFTVVEAAETPGLGSEIDTEGFKRNIRGRSAEKPLVLKKDGGDIDAVTAATISSRAALEAIDDARRVFLAIQSGDYTLLEDNDETDR